jgi:phage antirepressor YoqD-like protein
MVMSENYKVQAAVYDRMVELEQQPAFVIPQTLSEALLLAGQLAQEKDRLTAQIEADAPKVTFANVVSESSNSRCIRVWVKTMKNESNLIVGEQKVFEWLNEHKYIYRDKASWLPSSRHEAGGTNYFCVTVEECNGKPVRRMKITGKGVVALTEKVIEFFKPKRNGLVILEA